MFFFHEIRPTGRKGRVEWSENKEGEGGGDGGRKEAAVRASLKLLTRYASPTQYSQSSLPTAPPQKTPITTPIKLATTVALKPIQVASCLQHGTYVCTHKALRNTYISSINSYSLRLQHITVRDCVILVFIGLSFSLVYLFFTSMTSSPEIHTINIVPSRARLRHYEESRCCAIEHTICITKDFCYWHS